MWYSNLRKVSHFKKIYAKTHFQVEDLEDYVMDKRDSDVEGLKKEYEVSKLVRQW